MINIKLTHLFHHEINYRFFMILIQKEGMDHKLDYSLTQFDNLIR